MAPDGNGQTLALKVVEYLPVSQARHVVNQAIQEAERTYQIDAHANTTNAHHSSGCRRRK